ncbi:MAG: N-formylglutamate amidohydrolase, partial [Hyphomicrobiales bacterium]|nr:N-formylglutamate amidohydrolase [Hyphomicrobiales bacterium]
GFITEHYGSPGAGFHALQIEINRALYMNEQKFEKKPSFAQVRADMNRVTEALRRQLADMGGGRALAAE